MKYFLDTNICIHILNGRSQGVIERFTKEDPDDIYIPSMVAAELMYGAYKSVRRDYNLARVRAFLNNLYIIRLNKSAIELYGNIRSELELKGIPIGTIDCFISAITIAYEGTLVTNNTKEFIRVNGLNIEDWTTI